MSSLTVLSTNGEPHIFDSKERVRKKGCTDQIILKEAQIDALSSPPSGTSSSSSVSKMFGPLSKEEAEQLQLEANEETTRSEDLRLFLQEMRDHISQQNQQQQLPHPTVVGSSIQMVIAPPSGTQLIGGSQVSFGSQYEGRQPQQPIYLQQQQMCNRNSMAGAGSGHPPGMNMSAATTGPVTTKRSITVEQQDYVMDSAPDGGWGWLVVFGSFCCMIVVDGISLSYGLLVAPTCPGHSLQALESPSLRNSIPPTPPTYDLGIVWSTKARERPLPTGSCLGHSEMGEALNTQSRALLMTPGGFLVGIYLLLGPLSSALSNQFDFRPVAMTGGFIATIGFAGAAFSRNVETLTGTLGIIGGIGFGLIYLPAIATVGHWFKRRRPFAVGLALCGSGVGTIIGGQLIPLLVDWFMWDGTLIILAAVCAQCLAVIVLFRPLETHLRIKQTQHARKQRHQLRKNSQAVVNFGRLREERDRRRVALMEADQSAKAHNAAMVNATRANAAHSRAAKKALKAQQRRVIYRGSIMQRIIEEKRRQRTVSMGSLDGMVITRDNELIAAPLVADRPPIHIAASITRISEAVIRKMETRMAGGLGPSQLQLLSHHNATSTDTPRRCQSDVMAPPADPLLNGLAEQQQQYNRFSSLSRKSSAKFSVTDSKTGLSRAHLVRDSLPQLVQDYVQSQASMAMQKFLVRQQQTAVLAGGMADAGGSANVAANNRIRSVSNATNIHSVGSATPQLPKDQTLSALMQSRDLTVRTISAEASTPVAINANNSTARAISGLVLSNYDENEGNPSTNSQRPPLASTPRSCVSESISLRRTISDASLTSGVIATGGINDGAGGTGTTGSGVTNTQQIPLEIQLEVAELLDGEMRNEVQQHLRRELMRPQYKKDLFFTGSAHQLDHTPVTAVPFEVGSIWTKPNHSNWDIGPSTQATNSFIYPTPLGNRTPQCVPPTRGGSIVMNVDNSSLNVIPESRLVSYVDKLAAHEMLSTNISASVGLEPDPLSRQITLGEYGGDETARSRNSPLPQPVENKEEVEEDENENEGDEGTKCPVSCSSPICAFLEELLAPGLLLSPTFICMLLSNVLTMLGLVIPYFMFPDLAAEMNWTPSEAGSIISYIGFANTIGRCIATLYIEKAWSSHYKCADCLRVNVVSLLLSSAAVAIVPIIRFNYNFVIGAGCFFGLFSAVVVSLKSILVVELFGLDRLTNAFGHMLLWQGLSSIAAAPIGGYLWDVFAEQSGFVFQPWSGEKAKAVRVADSAFYFSALSLLGAALLACPLRCLSRRETISATYNNTLAGGVYVDDNFDGDYNTVTQQQATADNDGFAYAAGGALSPYDQQQLQSQQASTGLQSMQQLQVGGQSNQPQHLLPFDSGILSYDTANPGGGYPPTLPTSMLSGDPIVSSTLPPASQLPQLPEQQLLSAPPILSPAPLPSGLFLSECNAPAGGEVGVGDDGCDNMGTGGTPGDDDNLVTVAGVPLSVPDTPAPLAVAPVQSIVWNYDTAPVQSSSSLPPTEVKSLVEEPVLEPVIEEEEEDVKAEEAGVGHRSSDAESPGSFRPPEGAKGNE